MPIIYVVPGIGGTSLGTSPATSSDTWVSYTAMALGFIGRMRLAADGINPGPPDGVQLYAGRPLPDYYQRCIVALVAQLGPQGYVVLDHGYDWRLDAQLLGTDLAARIVAGVQPGSPCTIVAHSYGGLVARLAWSSLVGSGQSGLVRRIITLGSPHWGSYGAVRLWSLDSDQLTQVFYLSIPAAIVSATTNPFVPGRVWTESQLATLAGTMPCLYWTLPSLLAPDAAADPGRSAVYGTTWPASRGVSTHWLQQAMTAWQPLLAGSSTFPPAWVLTTVAGVGLPTPSKLVYPQILGQAGVSERRRRRWDRYYVLGVAGRRRRIHCDRCSPGPAHRDGRIGLAGWLDLGYSRTALAGAAARRCSRPTRRHQRRAARGVCQSRYPVHSG